MGRGQLPGCVPQAALELLKVARHALAVVGQAVSLLLRRFEIGFARHLALIALRRHLLALCSQLGNTRRLGVLFLQ